MNIKDFFNYFKTSYKIDTKRHLAYPSTFWLIAILIPFHSLLQIIFIEAIFARTNNFLGYSYYETYVLFGTFRIVQSLSYFFVTTKLEEFKSLIRGGGGQSFDNILTKPIDSQLYATLGRLNPGNISPVIIGIFLTIYGLVNSQTVITLWGGLSYIVLIIMGILMMYFTLLFFSTVIFWFIDLQMLEHIWMNLQEFGQYPTALYQGPLNIVFNFVLPFTLMAAVPAEFLFGRQPFYMFLVYIAVILGLFLATRWFWVISIKKYSSFSS